MSCVEKSQVPDCRLAVPKEHLHTRTQLIVPLPACPRQTVALRILPLPQQRRTQQLCTNSAFAAPHVAPEGM